MVGCAINGTILLSMGRSYAGVSANTSGSYIPQTNTVASGTVSSFNQQKHGAGSACYRPIPTDPFPNDLPLLVTVGGTTLNNLFYPPDSMALSNVFEIYTGGSTNSVITGANLPANIYYPAIEFSYTLRRAFVFGGATAVNTPSSDVYSVSIVGSGNAWTKVASMPVPRFGHKVVILSR